MNNPDIIVKEWQKHNFIALFQQVKWIYYIIYGVFIIVASFLIVNTIIMVIFERLKEIGMMGALVMDRTEIVCVFFLEALLLSFFGALTGMIIGGILTYVLFHYPINIEALTGGISFPTSNTIFIHFSLVTLISGFLFGMILSGLCTLLPSLKSAFIEPVEALRR